MGAVLLKLLPQSAVLGGHLNIINRPVIVLTMNSLKRRGFISNASIQLRLLLVE